MTVFYFLDGFTLTIPGNHLAAWEKARNDEERFIARPSPDSRVDLGAAYRVEVKR